MKTTKLKHHNRLGDGEEGRKSGHGGAKTRSRPTNVAARRQGRQQWHGTRQWSTVMRVSSASRCGYCDQRRARMVVTGLGGVAGFSVGLGMKNSCGAAGYTRIAGAGLGLFKIS
nr:hypothetical protein CFP56_57493 [Quercus suber]